MRCVTSAVRCPWRSPARPISSGGAGALAILWAAAEAGAVRFNEFKQTLEGIPPRTLAARLTELEEAGVLERQVFDSRPPRVEYRLTEEGRRLRYVVEALNAWATASA